MCKRSSFKLSTAISKNPNPSRKVGRSKIVIFESYCTMYRWIQERSVFKVSGVANPSIAIDRSIAESQLVDRAWFHIELTTYLKSSFFNQYFRKYIKLKNVAFYDILYLWLYYRLVDRELSTNFLVDPSRRQVDHPWYISKIGLWTQLRNEIVASIERYENVRSVRLVMLRVWTIL